MANQLIEVRVPFVQPEELAALPNNFERINAIYAAASTQRERGAPVCPNLLNTMAVVSHYLAIEETRDITGD